MPYSKRIHTPDEIRAFRREVNKRWEEKNPESVKARQKRWQQAHPEQVQATLKAYRLRHPLAAYTWSARRRLKLRAEYVEAYGGCCACCGENELLFLTLDHVEGNGADDRRGRGRNDAHAQQQIIRELKELGWPNDGHFRILCWNCQWGTRYPGGCPHQWPDAHEDR